MKQNPIDKSDGIAATVLKLQELATRLRANATELDDSSAASDLRMAADIIVNAVPFVIEGLGDIEDGDGDSYAARLAKAATEGGAK